MSTEAKPNQSKKLPPEGDPRRYVLSTRVRCSHCKSTRLKFDHTTDDGDVVTRHARCLACGGRFIAIFD